MKQLRKLKNILIYVPDNLLGQDEHQTVSVSLDCSGLHHENSEYFKDRYRNYPFLLSICVWMLVSTTFSAASIFFF